MCALAGIDVHYPMLDEAVVEHSTRVPSKMKLPLGRLRHFYKQAVRDFLPEQIINKPKQGFGLPFGVWLAEHRQLHELASDNLLRLRRRHIVRAEFIDRLMQLHQQSHAAYYGEFVWVLMMLELWLSSRGIEP
jgi:asparagine synthase (glutamine-hydrolysing)